MLRFGGEVFTFFLVHVIMATHKSRGGPHTLSVVHMDDFHSDYIYFLSGKGVVIIIVQNQPNKT